MVNTRDFSGFETYTVDTVVRRGHRIYDEWETNNESSRKIVSDVENAISDVRQNGTRAASVQALAFLFALELRVHETYRSILRCLLCYFAWRRETRALKRLKGLFHVADDDGDVRTVIEVALGRLREAMERGEADEGDDETHGGKRNGASDADEVAAEEKGQEQATKEDAERVADTENAKEASEEKAEDVTEPKPSEKRAKEGGVRPQAEELPSEDVRPNVDAEREPLQSEKRHEVKEETYEPGENTEPSTHKTQESKPYNDAVDITPFYEETSRERPAPKTSFIDEVIMDNIIKGVKDIVGHNPLDDVKHSGEADGSRHVEGPPSEERQDTDKDAFLYDETLANERGDLPRADRGPATQSLGKASETKGGQPKESAPGTGGSGSAGQGAGSLRETIQVDLTQDRENELRREISNNMSEEAMTAIYEAQASAMREQLSIASAELGIDAPVEVIGSRDHAQPEPPTVTPNRK